MYFDFAVEHTVKIVPRKNEGPYHAKISVTSETFPLTAGKQITTDNDCKINSYCKDTAGSCT